MTSTTLPTYDTYKDSGVEWLGRVPAHWGVKRNLGVFDERNERGRPDDELISVTIDRGVIPQTEITTKKDSSNEDKSKYKVLKKGDLVYNKMRAWQGALGISPYDGIVSPAYIVLRPKNPNLAKYFHYLYRTPQFITEANRLSYGLCGDMNSLRYEHFKGSYSPIPPDDEVDRIVAFLDEKTAMIDELIAKKKRQIELLDEQKNILINRAVTRGLNPDAKLKPSGIDWIGEIPEGWEVKRLGYIGRVGNGSTPSRSNTRFWDSPDFPWLNSSSVNQDVVTDCDQYVSTAALRECHLPKLDPGTVIVAITGQGKTRGTAALMKVHATINQHLAYLAVQDREILPEFVHLSLKAQYYQLRSISESGSTKGALTCQDIKEFKIAMPPRQTQEQIIKKCQEIRTTVREASCISESKIKSLTSFCSTLIAHAVTGKIKI
ncbi:MAG: restriction endonuclease subunit S [Verrucomicrobia bacterium]|nr:restriction endonuclease subunit S [Verrucomicrobiota bacterium]MCH8511144.1 restriction endonuclease subunit S [Kiritimatiellia bacterium]